jgi:hypothetical protein
MTFPQLDCGHVLAYFRRVLRYFVLGKRSAVLMLPWLGDARYAAG